MKMLSWGVRRKWGGGPDQGRHCVPCFPSSPLPYSCSSLAPYDPTVPDLWPLKASVHCLTSSPTLPSSHPPFPQRPITHALCSIREREASWIHKMARIRATNNALYFAITPVVAFVSAGCLEPDANWLKF